MTTLIWITVLLLAPVLFILWLTESKQVRIERLRSNGMTWAAIGERYSVSPTTAKRWATK